MIISSNLNDEFSRAKGRRATDVVVRDTQIVAPHSLSVHSGAAQSGGVAGFIKQSADIQNLMPPVKDPRLNPDQFYLPYFDAKSGEPNIVTNQWIEYYYNYHPLVGNAVEIHSQLPISRFGLSGVDDPEIMRVYEEMVDDLNLLDNIYYFLKCWWLYGEVMPYFWWHEDYNRFVDMTFIDTSRVRVRGHYLAFDKEGSAPFVYELEPDAYLRRLVQSQDRYDREVSQFIDPEIRSAVQRGLHIDLDTFSTELVPSKSQPWDLRGTSIITGILKDLLYSDSLRLAQNSIAQGHITPKWIWKLGQAGPENYMPTDDDLEAFRGLLMQANRDPVFQIITHYAINLDVVGAAGKILPIQPELDWVDKRIMTRLFTNRALTDGSGMNFGTASVAMRALMSRYLPVRAMIENFFKRKVFLPVALANDFYKRKQADLDHNVRTTPIDDRPMVPEFDWRYKQSLLDDATMRSSLIQLRNSGDLPLKVITDSIGLNYEEVITWLDKEQGTIADTQLRTARGNVINKAVQQATEGLKGFWESVKGWFLFKDQEEVENLDEGKATPDGYDAEENPEFGDTKAPSTSAPTSSPKAPGTDQPVGGDVGQAVTSSSSFNLTRQKRRARKPKQSFRAINRKTKVEYLTGALSDDDDISLNDWQLKLRTSPLDKESQDDVINSENHVLNVFDAEKEVFVNRLVETWQDRDSLSMMDFEHAVKDSITNVYEGSEDDLMGRMTMLYERAQEAAIEKIGRSKTGRKYINAKRGQMGDERERLLADALNNAFENISTVSDEVIEKMRNELHANQDDLPQNIVKTLFEELDAAELEKLPPDELAARLGEVWDKQRYIYQRIIRTETMNMYSRASLQEWYDAGYEKVIRREINDHRTCAYCRSIDGFEYDIVALLALDYPLIQNPDTKAYDGHPHCRGNYSLIISDLGDWDDFMMPPESLLKDVVTVEKGDTLITGVPQEFADAVGTSLETNDLGIEVTVNPDIVDSNAWIDEERERILREMEGKGYETPSDLRLDLMVDESRDDQRGQIALYETLEGDLLVSDFSFYNDDPDWFVLRSKGQQIYDGLDSDKLATVETFYNNKISESTLSIDDDGLEIIGAPVGGKAVGFITPAASQNSKDYFTESYALYQKDSFKLEFLDPNIYNFIKDSLFDGDQFRAVT